MFKQIAPLAPQHNGHGLQCVCVFTIHYTASNACVLTCAWVKCRGHI